MTRYIYENVVVVLQNGVCFSENLGHMTNIITWLGMFRIDRPILIRSRVKPFGFFEIYEFNFQTKTMIAVTFSCMQVTS